MNNRLIRISAFVLTVMLCFSLPVCANAANVSTDKVEIQSGDTLYSICAAHGVNFYSNKDLIMKLNGFTDAKQLDRLRVGDTICIPSAAKTDAVLYSSGAVVNRAVNTSSAYDVPAYYVVLYRLNNGDVIDNVYKRWDLNFGAYVDRIIAFNQLEDINAITAGQLLLLPVNRTDIDGEGYFTVYEHVVSSGESIASICAERGVDYRKFADTLRMFNPNVDLSTIYVGQEIYFPVSGVAAENTDAQVETATYGNAITAPAVTPASAVSSLNPVLPNLDKLYEGYGIVISIGSYLQVRLETEGCDVYLVYNTGVLNGYSPRPGDYVKLAFTPTDFLLASVSFVNNVFEN